jgi:methyl-accepting chemotaxis protein
VPALAAVMKSLFARHPSARARIAEAERRVEAAEARLQSVVDALPEGIVLLDAEGRYVLWNKRYAEIYHRSADLFAMGRRLMDTLRIGVERGDYPEAHGREEAWLAEREARLRNPGSRHEQQIADGAWLMIEERPTPDGGTVGLRVDITQMKLQARQIESDGNRRAEVMDRLGVGLARLSDGDLTCSIDEAFPPQYEPLRVDFNRAVASLSRTFGAISELAARVDEGATTISTSADQLSRRTEHQAATLEETAAALDLVTSAVLQNAEGADRARAVAAETFELSSRSAFVVKDAMDAMAQMQQSARQVEGIAQMIAEIAFHTKLLALNTSIEAAHAGDAGQGFSIIADEVRSLAEKSATAAGEIKDLVTASVGMVDEGAVLVNRTGDSFRSIMEKVTQINELVIDMAASAEDQAASLRDVNRAALEMDRLTQQNAGMVQETTSATHELRSKARQLLREMMRFKIRSAPDNTVALRPAPMRLRA